MHFGEQFRAICFLEPIEEMNSEIKKKADSYEFHDIM